MNDDEAGVAAFLRARLAEDEAVARAATRGPWRNAPTTRHHTTASGRTEEGVFGADAARVATTGEPSDRQNLVNAEHIARHDPARVLREVEAKRGVITEHTVSETSEFEGKTNTITYCPICRNDGACPTLRLMATVYADHPDYREEWRP